MEHKEIAVALRSWIHEAEHYSIVHFAVEIGISKDLLFKMATEDEELRAALDYALSVQEWKVAESAMRGELDRNVALKLLATYAGWDDKTEINFKGEMKYQEMKTVVINGAEFGRNVFGNPN
jgi:hypothetical protein